MSRETDVAWCAGFFDGEGHVSYHRSYPNLKSGRVSPQMYASVPQASENVEVLQFFQSVMGFGKVKGPYKMPGKSKPQHRLLFGVNEIEKLLIILKPYLRAEKTADFQRALGQYYLHDPHPTDDDWDRLMKKIAKKSK